MTETPTPVSTSNSFFQFILFGLIGVSGMVVDFVVVLICREWFHLDVRIGIFPAFFFAVTWNFELNRRITFKQEGIQLPWLRSYFSFVLICLAGLGLRWIATHVCIEYIGLRGDRFFALSLDLFGPEHSALTQSGIASSGLQTPLIRLSYIAYIVGIGVASLFNFFGSKWFAFAAQESSES